MKLIKNIIALLAFGAMLVSCADLDTPPVNLIGNEDIFTSEAGVRSYMARMYGELPIEDFKYTYNGGFNKGDNFQQNASIIGEGISRDVGGAGTDKVTSMSAVYKLIREANLFMETIPSYASHFSETDVKHFIAEARFIRAYSYYSLVKRYGGMPIVKETINYPETPAEEAQIPRNSEEEVWDFISQDLDLAIADLKETIPAVDKGRITKNAAYGFKSRIMLNAGSVAKYNETFLTNNGKMLCGIPSGRAKDYFKQAYDAAKAIETKYSLYTKNWVAGDKEAQYKNFVNLFFDASSPENLFVRYYKYPESVHGWDGFNTCMQQMASGGSGTEICPTLDFVEMFDGLPKNANGSFQTFDENGKYLLYDTRMGAFVNAEPRLRASVIFPGDVFKGEVIDVLRGIYIGDTSTGIPRLLPESSTANYNTINANTLMTAANDNDKANKVRTLSNGTKMVAAGLSGTVNAMTSTWGTISGFHLRKYMDESLTRDFLGFNKSSQTWIELRYAEVLLNRAEAAYELYELGEGDNYKADAYACVNGIRQRAGAITMTNVSELTKDVVRKERRKELAFENKTWNDLKRWRILDDEQNNRKYRVLMPFFADNVLKYFYDARTDEVNRVYNFDTRWYYQQIDGGDITRNPNLVQNPGY